MATVPNVVGLTQAAAVVAIVAATLQSNVQTANSATVAAGLVISTTPVATTTVPANYSVIVIVSTGAVQMAGNGYDTWGATGGDDVSVGVGPPIGQNLSYAVNPANALNLPPNQSVLSALSSGSSPLLMSTPAFGVPTTPKMGA